MLLQPPKCGQDELIDFVIFSDRQYLKNLNEAKMTAISTYRTPNFHLYPRRIPL